MSARWWLACSVLGLLAGCGVDPAERNNAGNTLYAGGDFRSALLAYQLAQVAAPDDSRPYFNAASAFAQLGDLAGAASALSQALKTADDDFTARIYYNLGNVYFAMSRFDQAVEAYQQTLRRHPDDADARYNLELALNRLADAPPAPGGSQSEATPTLAPDVSPTTSSDQTGEATLTAEEAERLLDAAQQDARTLHEITTTLTPPVPTAVKDW
jgi:tetratricopeptide (TPR) repeat protein